MARQLFANNAVTSLTSAAPPEQTTLQTGDLSAFPDLGSGDYFIATVGSLSSGVEVASEVVKCTAINKTTRVLTVERNHDNTNPLSIKSGDVIEIRLTADTLNQTEKRLRTLKNKVLFDI